MVDRKKHDQIEVVLDMLDQGMAVLRGDKRINPSEPVFGEIHSATHIPSDPGIDYVYRPTGLPGVDVAFVTTSDPLDYSEDRANVTLVPSTFEMEFTSSRVRVDIDPAILKQRLDLADYWVDADGNRRSGNDLGAGLPQYPLLHTYRYRANDGIDGRFPVDVELTYGDADPADPTDTRVLLAVVMRRNYPYLTPEMRKQKREEQKTAPWHAVPERSADQ